jgi:hypothetical protein
MADSYRAGLRSDPAGQLPRVPTCKGRLNIGNMVPDKNICLKGRPHIAARSWLLVKHRKKMVKIEVIDRAIFIRIKKQDNKLSAIGHLRAN